MHRHGAAPQGGLGLRDPRRRGADPAPGARQVPQRRALGEHLLHASALGRDRRGLRPAPAGRGTRHHRAGSGLARPARVPRRGGRGHDRARGRRHLRGGGAGGPARRARPRRSDGDAPGSTSPTSPRRSPRSRRCSRPGCGSTSTEAATGSSGRRPDPPAMQRRWRVLEPGAALRGDPRDRRRALGAARRHGRAVGRGRHRGRDPGDGLPPRLRPARPRRRDRARVRRLAAADALLRDHPGAQRLRCRHLRFRRPRAQSRAAHRQHHRRRGRDAHPRRPRPRGSQTSPVRSATAGSPCSATRWPRTSSCASRKRRPASGRPSPSRCSRRR